MSPESRRRILAFLAALVLLLAVASFWPRPPPQVEGPSPEIAALEAYQLVHEGYSRGGWGFSYGDYLFFIDQYGEIVEKYPGSEWADDAQFEIAHASYSIGNYEKAIAEYRRVVEEYPRSETAPLALYLTGRIYEDKLRDTEAAWAVYTELIRRYPGTNPASMAEGRLARMGVAR
ncbi:MAG: tetratricopeptide repeat protein [Candidatus Hydrothermarchaeota archaeon]